MNTLHKIAMVSLIASFAAIFSPQAKAAEGDGTIERFTCLSIGVPDNRLKGTFVKLNAKDQGKKLGFGGGDMALKLSNDGLEARNDFFTGTGGAATFALGRKENEFKIYVKPVNVRFTSCRIYICVTTVNGKPDSLEALASGLNPIPLENGWFQIDGDLDTFAGFRGSTVNRISFVLNANGDDGHILMGNTQVFSKKDVLDPSTIIMDESPCDPSKTCNFFVR
jgi:hypothetical protein